MYGFDLIAGCASAWAINPACEEAIVNLVIRRRRWRRIVHQMLDHLVPAVDLFLDRSRPVNLRMKKAREVNAVAIFDRRENLNDCSNVIGHGIWVNRGDKRLTGQTITSPLL